METVNGKLTNQKLNQFDEITHNIEYINRRCEYLQSQLTHISSQDNLQYFRKTRTANRFPRKIDIKAIKANLIYQNKQHYCVAFCMVYLQYE